MKAAILAGGLVDTGIPTITADESNAWHPTWVMMGAGAARTVGTRRAIDGLPLCFLLATYGYIAREIHPGEPLARWQSTMEGMGVE